jgi:hypothetical protein
VFHDFPCDGYAHMSLDMIGDGGSRFLHETSKRRVNPTIESEEVPDFDAAAADFRNAHREWLTSDKDWLDAGRKRDEHLLRNLVKASAFLVLARCFRAEFLAECKKRRIRGRFETMVIRFLCHNNRAQRDKAKAWADGAIWFTDHCPHVDDPDEAVRLALEAGGLMRIARIATGKNDDKPDSEQASADLLDYVDLQLVRVGSAPTFDDSIAAEHIDEDETFVGVYLITKRPGNDEELFFGPSRDPELIRRVARTLKKAHVG